jgi:hypothetical protein
MFLSVQEIERNVMVTATDCVENDSHLLLEDELLCLRGDHITIPRVCLTHFNLRCFSCDCELSSSRLPLTSSTPSLPSAAAASMTHAGVQMRSPEAGWTMKGCCQVNSNNKIAGSRRREGRTASAIGSGWIKRKTGQE